MKRLTKKSLDELAKTMNVIPEAERTDYWGMYEEDCFWRCVSYKLGTGISETAAAPYALDFFKNVVFQGVGSAAHAFLTEFGATVTPHQMLAYADQNALPRGIIGFPPEVLANYGFIGSGYHVVIYKGSANINGDVNLFCPQTNTNFTMSFSDYQNRTFQW